jgi:hypothetical protein
MSKDVPHDDPSRRSTRPLARIAATPEPAALGCPDNGSSANFEADEAAKREFLWHTHEYLGEYARYADTKAAFAGAIASALLGALYTARFHTELYRTPLQWPLYGWLSAAGAALLVASILLTIFTVLPRLSSTQSRGFIYWDAIAAHGSVELLQRSFNLQSSQILSDHLLHHIFDISKKVCVPKYRYVRWCIITLCAGAGLAAIALVLKDLSHIK